MGIRKGSSKGGIDTFHRAYTLDAFGDGYHDLSLSVLSTDELRGVAVRIGLLKGRESSDALLLVR